MQSTIRFCKDIGMFAYDRSREHSCIWRTEFCNANCFNCKLEAAFGHAIEPKDVKNDAFWTMLDGAQVKADLASKRNQTKRVRLMTRGEAFRTVSDIRKVAEICKANPGTLFWVPTRAWRSKVHREVIERELFKVRNLRLMASIDPSNTDAEIESIKASGWSTMFFGDDTATEGRMLCPKTHKHKVGACATCKGGCFSAKQTHVHLLQH